MRTVKFFILAAIFALFFLNSNVCSAQFMRLAEKSVLTNLDFELGNHGGTPENWSAGNSTVSGVIGINRNRNGSYQVSLDSLEKHTGNLSLKMEIDKRNNKKFGFFRSGLTFEPLAARTIEYIEFKGWIKTQDVKRGYAELNFDVAGEVKRTSETSFRAPIISSDKIRMTGNNDWTQVSIKMYICGGASSISFGGRFTGEGTVWFDNLEFYIKYLDVEQIEQISQLHHGFDK